MVTTTKLGAPDDLSLPRSRHENSTALSTEDSSHLREAFGSRFYSIEPRAHGNEARHCRVSIVWRMASRRMNSELQLIEHGSLDYRMAAVFVLYHSRTQLYSFMANMIHRCKVSLLQYRD